MNRKSRWIFTALAVWMVLAGCGTKTYKHVPDELVGVWKTSAPKYMDRFFELKKDAIVLGTGGNSIVTYSVTKTEMLQEKGETIYRVYYLGSEGDSQQWAFYFDAAGGGVVRLKSQKDIAWKRGG